MNNKQRIDISRPMLVTEKSLNSALSDYEGTEVYRGLYKLADEISTYAFMGNNENKLRVMKGHDSFGDYLEFMWVEDDDTPMNHLIDETQHPEHFGCDWSSIVEFVKKSIVM